MALDQRIQGGRPQILFGAVLALMLHLLADVCPQLVKRRELFIKALGEFVAGFRQLFETHGSDVSYVIYFTTGEALRLILCRVSDCEAAFVAGLRAGQPFSKFLEHMIAAEGDLNVILLDLFRRRFTLS